VSGRRAIETSGAPRPVGPYSQGVAVGDLLFTAGQLGLDPATGQLVQGGASAEAGRIMENLLAVLKAAGLGFDDVVKTTIFLTDLADFKAVNEVYARYAGTPPPARSTVQVSGLALGARVEIEAIAVRRAD
jgi:2-iminobutanoate/2-iminopropanoate deaminase